MNNIVYCDLCGEKMYANTEPSIFQYNGEEFHADALIYRCRECGYVKLGTCLVKFWMDDDSTAADSEDTEIPPEFKTAAEEEGENTDKEKTAEKEEAKAVDDKEKGQQKEEETSELDKTEEKPSRPPKMFASVDGKTIFSDEWIDWMLANKKWFPKFYDRFLSRRRKEERYLENHVPQFKAIINDTLYDTSQSNMYLMEEKDLGNELCRRYNYKTKSGKFFRIISRYENADELVIMDLKEVKKMLAQKPDVYREVVPDVIDE